MSIYQFAPTSNADQFHPFITWRDAFTESEIDLIKKYCSKLPKQSAVVGIEDGKYSEDEKIRVSNVSWASCEQESQWIYDRLAFVIRSINSKFFNFDLYGFVEDLQYTEYDGDSRGHYTWHLDMTNSVASPRKLSLVLQLSDPSEYEGGDLETFTTPEPTSVDKEKGLIAVFPSWALHRVTPVTSGVRHTLVAWIAGPTFK